MGNSEKDHWNNVYASKEVNQLGWYEKTSSHVLLYRLKKLGLD